MSDDFAVSACSLIKIFGRVRALDDLTIKIPRGVTYCLLGPNGSGKTTFIRAIVGLLHPDGGELHVLGKPVSLVRSLYHRIGYMTQYRALYPDLTVQENMEFFAGIYGIDGHRREKRIAELLELVDLSAHRDRLVGALSGGMYQRISLACTLIHEPELLLLDEPTVGVDSLLRNSFWEYFEELASQGKTVIITTHMMDEAERCKLVGYMFAGRLAAEGSPEKIMKLAGLKPRLELWLTDPESDAALLKAKGYDVSISENAVEIRLDKHDQIKEILEAVKPVDMRLREPTLEEAFLVLSRAL